LILSEKLYEVSMLEKGDIIRLTGGMKLLCDGVILKGKLKYLNFMTLGLWIPYAMAGIELSLHPKELDLSLELIS